MQFVGRSDLAQEVGVVRRETRDARRETTRRHDERLAIRGVISALSARGSTSIAAQGLPPVAGSSRPRTAAAQQGGQRRGQASQPPYIDTLVATGTARVTWSRA